MLCGVRRIPYPCQPVRYCYRTSTANQLRFREADSPFRMTGYFSISFPLLPSLLSFLPISFSPSLAAHHVCCFASSSRTSTCRWQETKLPLLGLQECGVRLEHTENLFPLGRPL